MTAFDWAVVQKLIWGLVVVAMAGGWASQAHAAGGETPKTPTIAIIAPASGDLAAVGGQLAEVAKLGAEPNGIAIEVFDEGQSSAEAVNAVKDAAQRREVVAAIGPVMRRHAGAAGRKAQDLGLPMISFATAAGVERQGSMIFRGRMTPNEQSRQVAARLVEDYDAAAVMAPRTEFGDAITTAMVDSIDDAGATVSAMGRYDEETTDFSGVLEVVTGSRAYVGTDRAMAGVEPEGTVDLERSPEVTFDAFVIADVHTTVARLIPFLPRFGIATGANGEGTPVQLVGLSGWRGDSLERVAEHLRGAIFFDTFGGEVDGPQARRFVNDVRNRLDREVTTPEAELYDLVSLTARFVPGNEQGEAARQKLARRLVAMTEYEGVSGRWEFNRRGAPVRALRAYRIGRDGHWMPIDGGW